MTDIAKLPSGTILAFTADMPPDQRKFDASAGVDVFIESVGGGGGGGGSGAGGTHGGSGGRAGGYFFQPVRLIAGSYRVRVGKSGVGGWSYGKGGTRPHATDGGASGVSHSVSGYDYAPARGGEAGQFGASAGARGEDGEGVIDPKTGKVISTGGKGGADDRRGEAGSGPGAGSGGCGHWKGQTDFQSDPGQPGRVTITVA